jgi:hypothetical protein
MELTYTTRRFGSSFKIEVDVVFCGVDDGLSMWRPE